MNATPIALDPNVSEFETAEQEAEHVAWIRAELERRRADPPSAQYPAQYPVRASKTPQEAFSHPAQSFSLVYDALRGALVEGELNPKEIAA
jgi:hypothetical protein